MSIQKKREEKKELARQARAMMDNTADTEWTEEKQNEYQAIIDKITIVDQWIENHNALLDAENKGREEEQEIEKQSIKRLAEGKNLSEDEVKARLTKEREIFTKWVMSGPDGLSNDEKEFVNKLKANNTLSTTTPSEGGAVAPGDFQATLLQELEDFGSIRKLARIIRSSSGNDWTWPKVDENEEGEIVGQNAAVSAGQDPIFDTIDIKTYKYSSKSIAVPWELIQDSKIDILTFIRRAIRNRLSRITERHFAIGNGTNQPPGLITLAMLGHLAATGQIDSITFDDLLRLEHSVPAEYRGDGNLAYMLNDATLLVMKLLKDANGRPLFLPGYNAGEYDRIGKYRYVTNKHVDDLGAGKRPVLFGDFSQYVIRDVLSLLFFRMTDSKYTEKGQIGFLAFSRHGAQWVSHNNKAIRYFENAAT